MMRLAVLIGPTIHACDRRTDKRADGVAYTGYSIYAIARKKKRKEKEKKIIFGV